MEKKFKSFTKIFNIFLIVLIINVNFSVQQNLDKINNNIQLDIQEYNIKNKFKKRKLDDDCSPLNISIDLINFNCTFPNDTLREENKDLIIESIYKAKYFIEDFINICVFANEFYFSVEQFPDWGIKYWDEEIKEGHTKDVDLDVNNFFIFFNFSNSIKNVASSKIVLTEGNPLVGVITINEQIEKSKLNEDYLTTLMIHQFIHLLGFHIKTEYFDENFIIENELDVDGETILRYYLSESSSPNVIHYAQKYFKCPGISEITLELDEDGNIHWPSRYFLGELMTEFTYPEEQILSGFTIAFLDDLIYLEVKKKFTGGIMSFGKHKDCAFLNSDCGQLTTGITVANEFYLPEITSDIEITNFEPSCSSSRLSKTVHKLYQIDEPTNHEYYQNGYAGRKSTNYCPISEYNEPNENYIYVGRCSSSKTSLNPSLENKLGETFSENSFCVLSSLVETTNTVNSEMRAVCYEMICSDLSLTIIIKSNYIVCPKGGGLIKAKNFEGYLSCPDFNLICGGKDKKLCNNIFNCYENEVEEKDELVYNYEIKTTQNSDIYKSSNPEVSFGWEEDENGFCPQYCMQCGPAPNKRCFQCAPGYEYNEPQNKCFSTDINCEKFLPNGNCEICRENFFLAEEDNEKLICEETSTRANYYYPQEGKNYKVKCKKIFDNCNTCDETQEKCLTCLDNYGLYYDGSKCVEKTSTLYYKEDNVYKLCSQYTPEKNCEKCQITEDNEYICLECKEDYGLIHGDEEPFPCELISSLPEKKYFSEDGKNYFKCENNDIANCNLCERKNECEECKTGYVLENAKTLCISLIDKESNMYAYNSQGFLMPCSSLIEDCNQCSNSQNCLNCRDGSGLTNNNKCISESLVEQNHNYYKDENNRYISCSIIENCISCISSTICISCQNGYKINIENICEKIDDENDNDLSKGAIAGIVIGCFAFLVLIIIGGYFLYKKVLNKKNGEIIQNVQNTEAKEDQIQENQENQENKEIEEQLEEKKITIHKRSIHNNYKI